MSVLTVTEKLCGMCGHIGFARARKRCPRCGATWPSGSGASTIDVPIGVKVVDVRIVSRQLDHIAVEMERQAKELRKTVVAINRGAS